MLVSTASRPRSLWAGLAAAVTVLAMVVGISTGPIARAHAAATAFVEDWESGTQDGWQVASGSFGQLITNRATFHNQPTVPYFKQGSYFLSTLETPTGAANDGYTGVVVSPSFTLTHPSVSLLVGGGNGPGTYVAVCTYSATAQYGCASVAAKAQGANSEIMQYRVLDLSAYVGQRVEFEIVDDSTGSWGHVTLDAVHADSVATPTGLSAQRTASAVTVIWKPNTDSGVAGYQVYRSTQRDTGFTALTSQLITSTAYTDSTAAPKTAYYYRVSAVGTDGAESDRDLTSVQPYEDLYARGSTTVYTGSTLTGVRFPVGPLGSAGILQDGTGARPQWWIFNNLGNNAWSIDPSNYTEGAVPNSFFAVRTQTGSQAPVVRAVQTKPVGAFPAMGSASFTGEYPMADYTFTDSSLPVKVGEQVVNPMLPGDSKDSAIPTAIYTFTLTNTSSQTQNVSLLSAQQNAVGYNGTSTIGGTNDDVVSGYGGNVNTVTSGSTSGRPWTSLHMTSSTASGSMNLTAFAGGTSFISGWSGVTGLYNGFTANGTLDGSTKASSPAADTTVDGALSTSVTLAPGASTVIPVALNWYFPGAVNFNGAGGRQYENWWSSADDVAHYVDVNWTKLMSGTQAFHDAVYNSNIPQYVLDRITSSLAVLRSPTVWWAKDGSFYGREGYGCCSGMPTHVWQYAQAQSWLWPDIGADWTNQWLANQQSDGSIPTRFGYSGTAFDGQSGVILSAYRTYETTSKAWLDAHWPKIKAAMEWSINTYDPSLTGMLSGAQATTLDTSESGTGSWLGSLYLASANAAAHMAAVEGDSAAASRYSTLYSTGRANQEKALWNGDYYIEKPQNLSGTVAYGDGSEIDMLLGQWWSTQLGLGDIYDSGHETTAEANLFANNFQPNFFDDNPYASYYETHRNRDFVRETDSGMLMITWPNGDRPSNPTLYDDEVMSGFEDAAAATMLQRGLLDQGLRVVKSTSDRYDGELRDAATDPWLHFTTCGLGLKSGSPFSDDECGNWYGRSLASYSLLQGLNGFTANVPEQTIGLAPTWQPADHKSFFSTGSAYGTFTQTRSAAAQSDALAVTSGTTGSLTVGTVKLTLPAGAVPLGVVATVSGSAVSGATVDASGTVRLASPVTVAAGSTLTLTVSLRQTAPVISGNAYVIGNEAIGQVVDDPGSSSAAGTQLISWGADGGANQRWRASLTSDGSFELTNVASGLCMDVTGSSNSVGAAVIQWPCTGQANQRWTLAPATGGYRLLNQSSGLPLAVGGTAAGTGLVQAADTSAATQVWSFTQAS